MWPGILASALVFVLASMPEVLAAAEAHLELSKLPAAVTTSTDFARDIQPLLVNHCLKCHGPEKQKGGLRLDIKASALKGGDDGKVILPGKRSEERRVGKEC